MLLGFWRYVLVVDRFEQASLSLVSVMPWFSVLNLFHAGLTDRTVTHGYPSERVSRRVLEVSGEHYLQLASLS